MGATSADLAEMFHVEEEDGNEARMASSTSSLHPAIIVLHAVFHLLSSVLTTAMASLGGSPLRDAKQQAQIWKRKRRSGQCASLHGRRHHDQINDSSPRSEDEEKKNLGEELKRASDLVGDVGDVQDARWVRPFQGSERGQALHGQVYRGYNGSWGSEYSDRRWKY